MNKIRNMFLVPDTKFVSTTNVARRQTGKHLRRHQCVRNNVSSFARALLPTLLLKDILLLHTLLSEDRVIGDSVI